MLRTDDLAINKMDHYLDLYHRLISSWKGKDISFLKIGIWNGGSIEI